jgi:class 3 adenylate cyclase
MDFYAILDQVIAVLRQRQRVTYRALKRQFNIDDDYLEDVKAELIQGQRLAVDEEGTVLVWIGETGTAAQAAAPTETPARVPLTYTPAHLAEKILTSHSALEGERKQVTVLFADLKGSMELLADRDPEEARQLLDPVLERMIEAVHRYEGTVNQVMGDGIMALFGAPIAHEDHAVRACYAALRMQETGTRYGDEIQRSHGVPVQIRVGLNSGAVVVRAIDSSLHMDYTAVGQTTHLAARMEQMAKPGSVLITGETLRLAEAFVQVKALGPVAVKGLAEPVEVFDLSGAASTRTRLQALAARGLTRFVGRQAEFEALCQALERAGTSHGQIVAIIGEPGVGKTCLVYEFIRSHHTHDWLVLESSSVSYGKATAYLPVRDLLKAYFQLDDRDDGRKVREKLTGKLLTLDAALGPTLPAFLTLLDVPVEDRPWQGLDPAQRRQRVAGATASSVGSGSAIPAPASVRRSARVKGSAGIAGTNSRSKRHHTTHAAGPATAPGDCTAASPASGGNAASGTSPASASSRKHSSSGASSPSRPDASPSARRLIAACANAVHASCCSSAAVARRPRVQASSTSSRRRTSAAGYLPPRRTDAVKSAVSRVAIRVRSSADSIAARPAASRALHSSLSTAGCSCSARASRQAIPRGTGPSASVKSSSVRSESACDQPGGRICTRALSRAWRVPPVVGRPCQRSAASSTGSSPTTTIRGRPERQALRRGEVAARVRRRLHRRRDPHAARCQAVDDDPPERRQIVARLDQHELRDVGGAPRQHVGDRGDAIRQARQCVRRHARQRRETSGPQRLAPPRRHPERIAPVEQHARRAERIDGGRLAPEPVGRAQRGWNDGPAEPELRLEQVQQEPRTGPRFAGAGVARRRRSGPRRRIEGGIEDDAHGIVSSVEARRASMDGRAFDNGCHARPRGRRVLFGARVVVVRAKEVR